MKADVKILDDSTKDIVVFDYKGHVGYLRREEFDKITDKWLEDFAKEGDQLAEDVVRIKEKIKNGRDKMTKEERLKNDESNRLFFERWQDEFNASHFNEDEEDYDNNPFRR